MCLIAAEVTKEPPSQPKWSLSHGERIKELRSLLKDSNLKYDKENIQAAIKYHKTFKPEEQCGSKKAFFKHGSQVDEEEFKHPQACNCIGGWAEVSGVLTLKLLLATVLIRLNSPLMKIHGVKSLTRKCIMLTNVFVRALRLKPKRKGKKSFVN